MIMGILTLTFMVTPIITLTVMARNLSFMPTDGAPRIPTNLISRGIRDQRSLRC
jgi:hypothetical protein